MLALRLAARAGLCTTLASCAAVSNALTRDPQGEPAQRVVLMSAPRGALVVLNGTRTLAQAPLVLPLIRGQEYGRSIPIMFEALPQDSTECIQAVMFGAGVSIPDTVRFDMHHCPPKGLDGTAIYECSEVTDAPVFVSALTVPSEVVSGRFLFEYVVDTAGRVEPSSLRVLEATRPGFVAFMEDAILKIRYWPARISGAKVRVRVQQPVYVGQRSD